MKDQIKAAFLSAYQYDRFTSAAKEGNDISFGDYEVHKLWIAFYAGWMARVTTESITGQKSIEWNGEGLPPIGTVCEVAPKCQGCIWQKVEIAYMGNEYFVVVCPERGCEESRRHVHGYQFRPIRTPEQIAAEERDAAIEQMILVDEKDR